MVCFGEGAGANILARFAVSTLLLLLSERERERERGREIYLPSQTVTAINIDNKNDRLPEMLAPMTINQ